MITLKIWWWSNRFLWFRRLFSNPFILITTYRIELIKTALERWDVRLSNAHKNLIVRRQSIQETHFYKSFHRHFSVFVPRLYGHLYQHFCIKSVDTGAHKNQCLFSVFFKWGEIFIFILGHLVKAFDKIFLCVW